MKASRHIFPCLFLFLLPLLAPFSLPAAPSVDDAARQIKERLPQIDAMKLAGTIGENARGYLSIREPLGPRQSSLVEAENEDRRIIYASIAGRTGQSLEEVGEQRALRIAKLAKPGVWLKGPDGQWYRKGENGA